MWSRLDDSLIDHRKVFAAGEALGKNGPAIVIGFYSVSLMWTNKHLTDGVLPVAVVKSFRHVEKPLLVADALVKAGLFEKNDKGFIIHDFADFNPESVVVKARQRQARSRQQRMRVHRKGES